MRFLSKFVIILGDILLLKYISLRTELIHRTMVSELNEGPQIRFRFDRDKFFTVMQVLCQKIPDLTILKALKLLYFIDREHLRARGKPVLGDRYASWDWGPVPYQSNGILNEIKGSLNKPNPPAGPIVIENVPNSKYPRFVTKEVADLDYLSQFEREIINKVIGELGDKTGPELMKMTHEHATWTVTQEKGEDNIDYKLFFKEEFDDCKDALEVMILEQEDRDFVESI